MNPEHIHNALNYLDDDLIAETDALRQGQKVLRTRPAARKIIAWVAPAACLALVLGLGSQLLPAAETGNAAPMAENQIRFPGEWIQDSMNDEIEESKMESSRGWQLVCCDDISIEIPPTWTHELTKADDGSYFIIIRPSHETGSIQVGYWPGFGVCGTGLTEEKTRIAGMEANIGYYDGSSQWSFITFRLEGKTYVVLKDGAESWWGAHGDTVMQILGTLRIGGKG